MLLFLLYRTKYVKSVDGKFGALDNNRSYNGLIGMLQRQEIDAGLMSFTQSYQRSLVADHTIPLGYLE